MTNSDTHGIVLKGISERKSLHFLVLAVISTADSSLSQLSAAGAPQSHYFSSVNTFSDPGTIEERILDVRRQMARERKNFYLEEVEEQFRHFLSNNLPRIVDFLEENDLEGLRDFVKHDFYKFDISNLNLDRFSPQKLRESKESDSPEPATESTGGTSSDSSNQPTTIEVAPEIDVRQGTRVEELEPGTPIVVRLTERSAELFGSSIDEERPRIPGDFLSFDPEGKEPEGEFRVRLQEDLHGVGEVSRGSLLRLHRPGDRSGGDEYERQLRPLVMIVVILLVLLVLFAYLVVI